MSVYTNSERTVKKYTVGQAVESAKRRMKHGVPVNLTCISGRSLKEHITLEEMNEIAEEICSDTMAYL